MTSDADRTRYVDIAMFHTARNLEIKWWALNSVFEARLVEERFADTEWALAPTILKYYSPPSSKKTKPGMRLIICIKSLTISPQAEPGTWMLARGPTLTEIHRILLKWTIKTKDCIPSSLSGNFVFSSNSAQIYRSVIRKWWIRRKRTETRYSHFSRHDDTNTSSLKTTEYVYRGAESSSKARKLQAARSFETIRLLGLSRGD